MKSERLWLASLAFLVPLSALAQLAPRNAIVAHDPNESLDPMTTSDMGPACGPQGSKLC